MNFLKARYLFPQVVDLVRYGYTKTFGSVSETTTEVATPNLACSIQTAPEATMLQFGAEGSEGVVSILFPENPGANPGDELAGRGIDQGRLFTVKDVHPAVIYNVTYWICDCTERR